MLQTAIIWTALDFLLATEIRSDILAGCSSEITNTSNFFCVEEMRLYSDCRADYHADAIKYFQDCPLVEPRSCSCGQRLKSTFSRTESCHHCGTVPPCHCATVPLRAATTAIHCHCHHCLPLGPGAIIATRAPVILDKRSIKDRVVCDASGGKQDGVDGCSKSVILW